MALKDRVEDLKKVMIAGLCSCKLMNVKLNVAILEVENIQLLERFLEAFGRTQGYL